MPAPATRPRELDQDTVVRAGVAVADEGGTGALTMAAVAHRLGPYTPMALYRYVGSKDGLIDLMLDHVTGEIDLPDRPGVDWRADLEAVALASWAMVNRHPWYAQLVHSRPPLGPNALRRTELVLEVLTGQGAAVRDAMAYAAVLDLHIFGSALQAAEERTMRRRYGVTDPAGLTEAIRALRSLVTPDRYPVLAAWMSDPSPASADDQFRLSLAFLLDGIGDRLAGPAPARDRPKRPR
jgi:AcrR family transcriptional regulator